MTDWPVSVGNEGLNVSPVTFGPPRDGILVVEAGVWGWIWPSTGRLAAELSINGSPIPIVGGFPIAEKNATEPFNGNQNPIGLYVFSGAAGQNYTASIAASAGNARHDLTRLQVDFAANYPLLTANGGPRAIIHTNLPRQENVTIGAEYRSFGTSGSQGCKIFVDNQVVAEKTTEGWGSLKTTLNIPSGEHSIIAEHWTGQGRVSRGVSLHVDLNGTGALEDFGEPD